MGETDSEQVPRGKDEKDFEKRVKECLKLSGGSGWGRRCVGRMRSEQSGPPIGRGVDRRGLRRWPKPGLCYARGDVAALIVVCSTRLTACLGICVLRASACGLPIRPVLKHGPRSLTCVRVNGGNSGGGHSDLAMQIVRLTWVGRGGCFVEPSHGIELKWAILPAHPGSGSAGGRVQRLEEHRRVAWCRCIPAALENPEDRVPLTPGRKGSRQNGSVTGKGLALRAGLEDPSSEPVDCWRTARAANAARAARRVSAEGRTGNSSRGVSWASNSQLRTVL
ncbi:hypothetical protein Bca52824_094607 [Brassica carinata]|uniref:Uncharacterized protein n=1 Tax=Brassica carinata TaxID=52824 RepID=A0A8X7TJ16_BRACI|nr:hypothetical protein Bca52824_094607 [Brassica carinata]